jgi:hypothetical protein
MNLLNTILTRIADRLNGPTDANAVAAGFTFTTMPDGRRTAHLSGMQRIAADHRARVAADPDPIDRVFLTPAVRRQIRTDQARHTPAVHSGGSR